MVELREAAGRICLANIQPAFNCYTFFQLCLMLFPNTFDHGRVGWAKCHFLSNLWPRKAQVEARLPGCLLQRCYSYLVRVYERSCPVSIILRHLLTPQWRGQNSPPTWQIMESLMEAKECHHLSVATVFHHDLSTEALDRPLTGLAWRPCCGPLKMVVPMRQATVGKSMRKWIGWSGKRVNQEVDS